MVYNPHRKARASLAPKQLARINQMYTEHNRIFDALGIQPIYTEHHDIFDALGIQPIYTEQNDIFDALGIQPISYLVLEDPETDGFWLIFFGAVLILLALVMGIGSSTPQYPPGTRLEMTTRGGPFAGHKKEYVVTGSDGGRFERQVSSFGIVVGPILIGLGCLTYVRSL